MRTRAPPLSPRWDPRPGVTNRPRRRRFQDEAGHMKYLCLVYAEETKLAEIPEESRLTARSLDYNHDLK